jgi:hypothetical protein
MNRRLKLIAVLTLSLAVLSTGCIGHFGLSGKVRQFNLEQTEDRWGREILFVILYVIPVYPFAGFADIVLFNSIEFWTGKNPINDKPSSSTRSSSGRGRTPSTTSRASLPSATTVPSRAKTARFFR